MSALKLNVHNLDQLVRVSIYDRRKYRYINYQPYKKRWWCKDQQEGYLDTSTFGERLLVSEQELKDGYRGRKYIVEDKTVFHLPFVELKFSDGSYEEKKFQTYREAHDWFINEITGKVKNIIIEYIDLK